MVEYGSNCDGLSAPTEFNDTMTRGGVLFGVFLFFNPFSKALIILFLDYIAHKSIRMNSYFLSLQIICCRW